MKDSDNPAPTTYRTTCGSRWGISMHVEHGEVPCGICLEADDLARARHEARLRVPERKPVDDSLHGVIALLAQLLADHDTANDVKARRRIAA
jgi:hypothetical protein